MKKILLFFVAFMPLLSCSLDDDSGNATDPIIGTWDAIGSYEEFFDEQETTAVDINFEYSIIFNIDGTAIQSYSLSANFEGEEVSDSGTEAFTWENSASNPDFDSINQTYRVTFTDDCELYIDLLTATFSADFNTLTTTDDDGEVIEWTKK